MYPRKRTTGIAHAHGYTLDKTTYKAYVQPDQERPSDELCFNVELLF